MSINILFTSVGRRVELLNLFHEAYRSLDLDGHILGVDIDPLAPALTVTDRAYIVPRFDDPSFVSTLATICFRERVNLVLPLIDPDILVLARARSEIQATGAQVVAVSTEAASLTSDKWETMALFRSLGLSTPRSWLPGDQKPAELDFPLFIKPRRGSAAKDTFKVCNREELDFFSCYVREPIVQEFIEGPEVTCDVFCDLRGEVLAVVARKRIEVRWGEVAKGVTVYAPEICNACVRVAQKLPGIGPVTVQCILRSNKPYFTEINARAAGGVPLSVRAGVDWPRWLLAQAAGLEVRVPPLGTYKTGLFISRFDNSVFCTEAQHDEIASHRI